MASFIVGNYYKNTSREVVILVTSRTKCFISFKEFWISDLINNGKSYTEGRVKVKLNDNDEYILVDRFSEYKATNNYVIKEGRVKKEHYSTVHRNFLKVGQKFRYVDLKNNIDQDVVFEDTNDNGAVLNFKAIDKNGNKFSCESSLFVVTEYNQKCLKPFTNNVAIATEEVKEVKNLDEVVKSEELLQGDCDLAVIKEEIKTCLFDNINDAIKYVKSFSASFTGSISSNDRTQYEYSINGGTVVLIYKEHGEHNYRVHVKELTLNSQDAIATEEVKSGELLQGDCDLPEEEEIKKIRPLNFKEIKRLAGNNGYELESLYGMFRLIKIQNKEIKTFSNLKSCKDFITEENKEVRIRKINLKVDGKTAAINLDIHHTLELTHDPIFGWRLVGIDLQELREPLNSQTKEQPTLKFKTKGSAIRFATKLMAEIEKILEEENQLTS